jgi:hypothetical protein
VLNAEFLHQFELGLLFSYAFFVSTTPGPRILRLHPLVGLFPVQCSSSDRAVRFRDATHPASLRTTSTSGSVR